MKKFALALVATTAFAGSAFAADMTAPRPYAKAPAPVAYAPSWTGCYVGGGGGYGLWNQDNTPFVTDGDVRIQSGNSITNGGRGYFGTVQAGCDYQFPVGSWNMVAGAFGDYDFASLKGNIYAPISSEFAGSEKMRSAWSAGMRLGWLVTPTFLTYFSGGYTEAHFGAVNFTELGIPTPLSFASRTYNGYFLGAGDEYALSFLPGLFWKTEYRFSTFSRKTNDLLDEGEFTGSQYDSKKYVQTIRSELTYHFNWSGAPLVAKY